MLFNNLETSYIQRKNPVDVKIQILHYLKIDPFDYVFHFKSWS